MPGLPNEGKPALPPPACPAVALKPARELGRLRPDDGGLGEHPSSCGAAERSPADVLGLVAVAPAMRGPGDDTGPTLPMPPPPPTPRRTDFSGVLNGLSAVQLFWCLPMRSGKNVRPLPGFGSVRVWRGVSVGVCMCSCVRHVPVLTLDQSMVIEARRCSSVHCFQLRRGHAIEPGA